MADNAAVPVAGEVPLGAPLPSQVRQWGSLRNLSSLRWCENALATRPFERMPWLAVAMLVGIYAWFALSGPAEWIVFIGFCGAAIGVAMLSLEGDRFPFLRAVLIGVCLMLMAGIGTIWARSELVGAPAIGRPIVDFMSVRILERQESSQNGAVRLIIATDEANGEPIRARIPVPERFDSRALTPGAAVHMRLRLIAPTRAVVPGAYDFAREAWFDGIAATGSVMSEPEILTGSGRADGRGLPQRLADHVRARIEGAGGEISSAAIAATLITGERSGMEPSDAQAMRDAGLAHLLSISGLHVGAVIGITFLLVTRSLAFWPWLTLRVPLPLLASLVGALAGLSYTLLSGAALPTIRACVAALLVLTALALGRQALSMRLVAIAAIAVMLFWPEAVIGPSFQLSFAAVIAIVALHNAAPAKALRIRRGEDGIAQRAGKYVAILFMTGLVIEIALLPLVLFHFHRAGLYGAAANLFAIPLTTVVIMPLLAVSLVMEVVGIGAPFWSLSAQSIDLLLMIARETAGTRGSVTIAPLVPIWLVAILVLGVLWLALWSGKTRLLGVGPVVIGLAILLTLRPPDLLVSGDGRHVAFTVSDGQTYFLRTADSFNRDVLAEMSGIASSGEPYAFRPIEDAPRTRCSESFCALQVGSSQGPVDILIGLGRVEAEYESLIAACSQSDIVIAENALPEGCKPRWLRLDGRELSRRGGAAIDLDGRTVKYVRPPGDRHGW